MRVSVSGGLVVFLLGCGEQGVTRYNAEPTATITSHAGGETVIEGVEESLRGVLGDPDGDPSSLSWRWFVGGVEICLGSPIDSYGMVTCEHAFVPGDEAVSLEVSDAGGASASDHVTLVVQPTEAPTAVITSPSASGTYLAGELLTFAGWVADAEDDPSQLAVVWETERLGNLALTVSVSTDGQVTAYGELPEGPHAVHLSVTDTTGKSSSDAVLIQVEPPNADPECALTAPVDGATGPWGDEVRFEGTVADPDIGAEQLAVTWTSDLDGVLRKSIPSSDGEVAFAYADLSVGTHTIVMSVADQHGATCTDFILYTVGTPPTIAVTAPSSGDVVGEDDSVLFAATVADGEDLPSQLALSWSSDLDGEFSTQGADAAGEVAFTTRDLSVGEHLVTVQVTDTDGLFVQSTLVLVVNVPPTAPTVSLSPDPAYTDDELLALATGSVDPEGDSVSYAYAWFEDGIAAGASTSLTFPAGSTVKHRTYRVVVTPSDGVADGPTGEAEVTVLNSAPSITIASLGSGILSAGDTTVCVGTASDPDGDSVAVSYVWHDGSTGGTYAIPVDAAYGDVITCTLTADDGDGGIDTAVVSGTVANAPPSVVDVAIDPIPAVIGEVLNCTWTFSDPDGDPDLSTVEWLRDGVSVGTGASWTASGTAGQVATCRVTPFDGVVSGSPVEATATLVDPLPPTSQVGFLLTEWEEPMVHWWDPGTGALSDFQPNRSNDADCNEDEGRSDGWLVDHEDDYLLSFVPWDGPWATIVLGTPFPYPKHVAVLDGNLLVGDRNDGKIYHYTTGGGSLGTVTTGYPSLQGLATDGAWVYASVWDGGAAHILRYTRDLLFDSEIPLPTGLLENNLVDFAYDRRTGLWYGLNTTDEHGTDTYANTVVEFEMGGAVLGTYAIPFPYDGIGVYACD